jgi:hypothetical protein
MAPESANSQAATHANPSVMRSNRETINGILKHHPDV